MNKRELQTLANNWMRSAEDDLRAKVIDYMVDTDISTTELADELCVEEDEINEIINGNGDVPISTFAKILIASGYAIEMKPLEHTPFAMHSNICHDEEYINTSHSSKLCRFEQASNVILPKYTKPSYTSDKNPLHSFSNSSHDIIKDKLKDSAIEAARQRYINDTSIKTKQPQTTSTNNSNPFSSMPISKMKDIIEKNLWDSEIDVEDSSRAELIDFLVSKDKMRKQYLKKKEVNAQTNTKANEFLEKVRSTVNTNPHLKSYLKNILGDSYED